MSTSPDDTAAVLPALPEGAYDCRPWAILEWQLRAGKPPYHHCPACDGWVYGHPIERRVDTLGALSGRRGRTFHCRRCDGEIGFMGAMA